MWFNMADEKLAFPNPPNITPLQIGIDYLAYIEFTVIWEIVKLKIGVWLFVPLTNLHQMENSKFFVK